MPDTNRSAQRWWILAGLCAAGAAWASPWDIDMIDARSFRAYEWKMRPSIPAGSLQRSSSAVPRAGESGTYQTDYIAPGDRMAADGLVNPYGADTATLAMGEKRFQVSCAPCHGLAADGQGPVTKMDPAAGINRFPVPAPPLKGAGSSPSLRSDGYLYYTIRNGGLIMPAYGDLLTDRERWAVVAYLRTLEGNAAPATTPAPAPAAPPTGTPG